MLDSLVVRERVRQKREETPSLLAIDSQFKIMPFVEEQTFCINGRKRSIAVDRLGLPWAITSANTSDNEAGKLVLERLRGKVPCLKVIAADQGYKVSFIEYARQKGWRVEIAQKPESAKGFVPQKDRWPVERSFGWLTFRRRLFRDVEKTVESSGYPLPSFPFSSTDSPHNIPKQLLICSPNPLLYLSVSRFTALNKGSGLNF